ncbi:MAG: haloacid dehalogenase [Candidatus Sericytochromatia bacterium]
MRGQSLSRRTFWWDRTRTGPVDAEAEPLRAVIFDLEALAEVDDDGQPMPKAGLIDLVMSLFVSGIWVGVVSSGRRAQVDQLVRELIGDGLVETIVTSDDADSTDSADLFALALWEFGIEPKNALAVVGSEGLSVAAGAGLAAVSTDFDELDSAPACERVHRRSRTMQKQAA